MYQVIKLLDGRYTASCRIQDGTEIETYDSAHEAIKAVIAMAKILNWSTIAAKDIQFLQQQKVIVEEVRLVPWDYKRRES